MTMTGAASHAALVDVLSALGDPSRLGIVQQLLDADQRVVDLTYALGLAQSTVSAHLSRLRTVGVVASRPMGGSTLYRLAHPQDVRRVLQAASRLVTDASPPATDLGTLP